jgi:glycosyltransferase involved in cell wall biosynthesis
MTGDPVGGGLKILLVIPVFNHGKTLRNVAEGALAVWNDVLVVDDGSTDEGVENLSGLDLLVVRNRINQGKGAAIMTAAREAEKLGMSHLVTLDADGQHDPADFLRFLPLIRETPQAVIVGRRLFDRRTTPLLSRFGRAFSNFWFRVQTGQILTDTQTGFRAYPLEVLNWLNLHQKRYAFEVEVLVKAAWAGLEFREVDISVHYPPAAERISHFKLFKDNLTISFLNTWLTIRAVIPFPHKRFQPRKEDQERISILHPLKSIRILLRRNTSPRTLALSAGLGVMVGTLPLIGLWTLTVLITANFFRLNKLAALSSSQVGNFPLLPALCIEMGYYLRKGRFLTEFSLQTLGYQAPQRFYEWFLGSLFLGPLFGFLTGLLVYGLVRLLDENPND